MHDYYTPDMMLEDLGVASRERWIGAKAAIDIAFGVPAEEIPLEALTALGEYINASIQDILRAGGES